MAVDILQPLKTFERPLQDSIRELRRGYQSVSECREQTLAECDARTAELSDCRRQLSDTARRLAEREQQLAERTQSHTALTAQYGALQAELDARRAELAQSVEKTLNAETH